MNNYIVYHYSLQVSQPFLDIIRSFKQSWSCGKDLRIVRSEKSADQIFKELSKHISKEDELIVVKIDSDIHHSGFKNNCAGWLDLKT